MEDSKFEKRGQVDLPTGKRDGEEEGSDRLHSVQRMVASSANLILQHLCVCTFLEALEKAGFLERVRMLSATKQPKDDRTAEVFEDYQVQYILIENPTAADDGPVTKDHEKIPARNESVLQYSAGCIPFPGGGKGSVDDSGNYSLTKDTNGDNLSLETPAPPSEMQRSKAHASCNRSGSWSDDSDSPTPPPHTNTFVEYNHDEEEDKEIQGPVQVSGVNDDSWSYAFDRIPLQYTTGDWNISSHVLTSPVEEDPANIVQPQPVPSLLDTGQQVNQHPLAKPPESLKDKEEVVVTPEEESVMPFSQVVITHNPTAEDDPHQQTPPGHGPFPSPSALDDLLSITDDHVYLTTAVEESCNPGGSACIVTGYNPIVSADNTSSQIVL